MPSTRRQLTRQRRTTSSTVPSSSSPSLSSAAAAARAGSKSSSLISSRISKPSAAKRPSHLHPHSATKMVSTRSSARAAAAASRNPAPSASPSSSTRAPTFPELVRARVAYSPAPSHGSVSSSVASPATVTAGHSSSSSSKGRHPHWIQWPSQLAESSAPTAPHGGRASSLPYAQSQSQLLRFDRASTADTSDLGHYAALLQGALRKGRETTGSPA